MTIVTEHNSLPIVQHMHVNLEVGVRERLQALAKRLLASEPTLNRTDMFGQQVHSGLSDAPALLFEDHTELSLFREQSDTPLQYRSFLLTGADDFFLINGPRFPEFETYCREFLDLDLGTVLKPTVSHTTRLLPLSLRCAQDPVLLERLCATARRNGDFNLVPYIGTGYAWRLAAEIASRSGAVVRVAAPPPRLTRRVNDKLWFFERVREALGGTASPLVYSVFGPAALSGRLRVLASKFPQIAVKVPDSSGSMGNVMVRSDTIAGKSLEQVRRQILDTLIERGWSNTYPLLVGVWDYPVIASPSVNLWIPNPDDGPPVLEGLFSQVLQGDNAEFVGAEPCDLPKELERRIAWEATCLAQYFQNLGYFGRCGFDLILIGDSLKDAAIHWIECNGRWGGVSIPITVTNRLIGDWRRKFPIIVQRTSLNMPRRPLSSILELLKGHLFSSKNDQEGVVLIAPGRLIDGSGMNFLVLGDTKRAANVALQAVTTRLLSA